MNNELLVPSQNGLAVTDDFSAQIEVAHRHPRNVKRALENSIAMACMDKETAESCFYSLDPRGDSKERISGPSIRAAEILASNWGNMRVESRILDESGTNVIVEASAIDLENNYAIRIQKARRITYKNGGRFGDYMIATTANASTAIAFRDAVFKIIPKVIVNQLFECAREKALDGAKTLQERREKTVEYWREKGVKDKQLFEHLGIKEISEITIEDIDYLLGVAQGIKNKDYDIKDAFCETRPKKQAKTLDDLVGKTPGEQVEMEG